MLLGVQVRARLNNQLRQKLANMTRSRLQSPLRLIRANFHCQISEGVEIQRELFHAILNSVGLFMKSFQEQTFFNFIDKDRDGKIRFQDFFEFLKSPLQGKRKKIVERAWERTKNGEVMELSQVASKIDLFPFQVYRDRQILIDTHKLLRIFKDCFNSTDGKVTKDQFFQYHEDLGVRYVDDHTFFQTVNRLYMLEQVAEVVVQRQQLEDAIKLIRYKIIQSTSSVHDEFKMTETVRKFESDRVHLNEEQFQNLLVLLRVNLREQVKNQLFKMLSRSGKVDMNRLKATVSLNEYKV